MKTKQLLTLCLFALSFQFSSAQVTETTNSIVSTSSYLGTYNNKNVNFRRGDVPAGSLSTTTTSFGVNSLALPNSVSIGVGAGQFTSGAGYNTYIGQNAGGGASISAPNTGNTNTFVGNIAGQYNVNGSNNAFFGIQSGYGNTSGSNNAFFGANSGGNNGGGDGNVFIGVNTGSEFGQGDNNCFIGYNAGQEAIGSNNIFLGSYSGASYQGDNKLMIDVVDSQYPLIWGDFANDQLKFNGKVGIGGTSTAGFGNYPTTSGGVSVANYKLFVKGGILTEEVRVNLATAWADYVFDEKYNLKALTEVEQFIAKNGHLPNVPSAKEVKENGIELGEMAKIQQEKIEELTLYVIEQNKINQAQDKEIKEMKAQIELLLRRQ
ncbi:MAG: hypothetical protein V4648_04225 [Bacteroidota bacterium]